MKTRLLKRLRREAYEKYYIIYKKGFVYYVIEDGVGYFGIERHACYSSFNFNDAYYVCKESRRKYILKQLSRYRFRRFCKKIKMKFNFNIR